MLQASNRPDEITGDTVEAVTATGKTTGYYDRKAVGQCVYPRCPEEACVDSVLCEGHRADKRNRTRRSQNALRKARRRAGLCPRCGERAGEDYMCSVCRVRYARIRRGGDGKREDNSTDRTTRTSAGESDGYARTRFHGQARKGAPGIDEQDQFERKIVDSAVRRYLAASEWLASPQGKQASREERDATRMEALHQLELATKAADDILERNRYQQKRERVQQAKLSKTAREIAKSGR